MREIHRLPLNEITAQDIQDLIASQASETSGLFEFKKEMSLGQEVDKIEFCTDLASFANAAGGLIIYGIKASDGIASELTGTKFENWDNEKGRITQIADRYISPRLPGLSHEMLVVDGKNVIVIRVLRSPISPHAVAKDGHFKFFSRVVNIKTGMDMPQLRAAFSLSENLKGRINGFRAERVGRIFANAGAVQLLDGAKIALHLVPADAFSGVISFDLTKINKDMNNGLHCMANQNSYQRQYNIDGLLDIANFANESSRASAYVQVFDNGIIESVDIDTVISGTSPQYGNSLSASAIVSNVKKSVEDYCKIMGELGITPPIYLFMSMTGVKGKVLYIDNYRHLPVPADRSEMYFPEVVIEELDGPKESDLRPLFNSLWRGFGRPACPWYDASGKLTIPVF